MLPNGTLNNLANKGGKMTSKDLSIFNSLRPFSVGFDELQPDKRIKRRLIVIHGL